MRSPGSPPDFNSGRDILAQWDLHGYFWFYRELDLGALSYQATIQACEPAMETKGPAVFEPAAAGRSTHLG